MEGAGKLPQSGRVGFVRISSGNAGVEQRCGCCSHHLWKQRALRGAPKAEAPPGKALEREELLFQALSAPGRPGFGRLRAQRSFLARRSAGYPGAPRRIPNAFLLSSPPLCSVLRAGDVFIGTSPSYSWFPSLLQAHPGVPWGKNPL